MPPRARTPAVDDLPVEQVPLSKLRPDPKNARLHGPANIDAIKASLEKFGQRKPIVVSRNYTVVAGNGTMEAAELLGWDRLWVTVFPGTPAEARAYAIADNRSADLASWDNQQLAEILQSLDAPLLAAAGFVEDDIAQLLNTIARDEAAALNHVDDVPDVPTRPTSKRGDVWLLGDSRLLVGDCTDGIAVANMLDADRCDVMWTDPPYGVDYVGKTKNALTVQNDGAADTEPIVRAAFTTANDALRPGAPIYVAHPPGPQSATFQALVIAAGWEWRETLVWVKNSMVLGHSDYHYRHEGILYGFLPNAPGTGRRGRGGKRWFGDNTQTTVFEIDKPSRSETHPTMKPVELVARCLANSCPPGGLVYDPFAGSGSTLIAAHTLGLLARLVEIDPAYADVICRRWQQHTGIVPILQSSGQERDFV